MDEFFDWILKEYTRVAMVIPVASDDPWTLHEPENVCIGCLPIFVDMYLADVPTIEELLNG